MIKYIFVLIAMFSAEVYAEEVDVICHCVNDCERNKKCESVWNKYKQMRVAPSQSLSEEENEFMLIHKVASLEFVDWGLGACGTVFGVIENEKYRFDFELFENELVSSKLTEILELPSIAQRKKAKESDLCISKK